MGNQREEREGNVSVHLAINDDKMTTTKTALSDFRFHRHRTRARFGAASARGKKRLRDVQPPLSPQAVPQQCVCVFSFLFLPTTGVNPNVH